jgi:hypothetical protein
VQQYPELGFILSLQEAFRDCSGEVLRSFCLFAADSGHYSDALFLRRVAAFRQLAAPEERYYEARTIVEDFIVSDGTYSLGFLEDYQRVGFAERIEAFANRGKLRQDFFDALVEEVISALDAVWKSFVAECRASARRGQTTAASNKQAPGSMPAVQKTAGAMVAPSNKQVSGSGPAAGSKQASGPASTVQKTAGAKAAAVASEPIPDISDFVVASKTVGRAEIAKEMARRKSEQAALMEDDEEDDEDEGVEDSPDRPAQQAALPRATSAAELVRSQITKPYNAELEMSPGTATSMLSLLTQCEEDPCADTIRVAPRAHAAPIKGVFAQPEPKKQLIIRHSTSGNDVHNVRAAQPPVAGGAWPCREAALRYAEGTDAKKVGRFVVLKNQSLQIWASEANSHKAKENPLRELRVDQLLRCTLVRDNSSFGGPRWDLVLRFANLGFAVVLSDASAAVLKDWEAALLDSAPNASRN